MVIFLDLLGLRYNPMKLIYMIIITATIDVIPPPSSHLFLLAIDSLQKRKQHSMNSAKSTTQPTICQLQLQH